MKDARLPQRKRRCTAMCRAIRLAYSSLETHMSHAVQAPRSSDYAGTELFNARTIREYAEIILICAWELEYLNLKRRCKTAKTTVKRKSTKAV
jgi:hypothetical protein